MKYLLLFTMILFAVRGAFAGEIEAESKNDTFRIQVNGTESLSVGAIIHYGEETDEDGRPLFREAFTCAPTSETSCLLEIPLKSKNRSITSSHLVFDMARFDGLMQTVGMWAAAVEIVAPEHDKGEQNKVRYHLDAIGWHGTHPHLCEKTIIFPSLNEVSVVNLEKADRECAK